MRWTLPTALEVFFLGPGGIGLAGIALGASGHRVSMFGLRLGSWSTPLLVLMGVFLVAAAVPFLYAGATKQVVLELDSTGISVWRLGKVHHTAWHDVVSLTPVAMFGITVFDLHRRHGKKLRIAPRLVRDDLDDIRARIEEWLIVERPDACNRTPGRSHMPRSGGDRSTESDLG